MAVYKVGVSARKPSDCGEANRAPTFNTAGGEDAMSVKCDVSQLYARKDEEFAQTAAKHANAWILTGEDPDEIILNNNGVPRRFASVGSAITWLNGEMQAYNQENPHVPAGYDVHLPDGEVRVLRPDAQVVAVKSKTVAQSNPKPLRSKHNGNFGWKDHELPPAKLLKKFGPHEWTKLKTPVYVREGFLMYECNLCGIRVRVSDKDKEPGIPGTCSRNVIEEEER